MVYYTVRFCVNEQESNYIVLHKWACIQAILACTENYVVEVMNHLAI